MVSLLPCTICTMNVVRQSVLLHVQTWRSVAIATKDFILLASSLTSGSIPYLAVCAVARCKDNYRSASNVGIYLLFTC